MDVFFVTNLQVHRVSSGLIYPKKNCEIVAFCRFFGDVYPWIGGKNAEKTMGFTCICEDHVGPT